MKKERTKARLADLVLNSGQLQWLPANPRTWRQEDINKTKKSLQTDPDFLEEHPVLLVQHGKKFVVFAGNLRTTAAKELKWETIEAVLYTPETDEDKTTILRRSLLDNGQFGSWDYDALANEWHEFQLTDFGIPAWDAAKDEEESPQQVEEDDFNEETDAVETRCKAGDIWQLGEHRLMCGDSTDAEQVALLMNGERADIAFTSPPYNLGASKMSDKCPNKAMKNGTAYNEYDDNVSDDEYTDLIEKSLGNALDFTDDAMFNIGILKSSKEGIIRMMYDFKDRFCDIIVWNKSQSMPLGLPSHAGCIGHRCELIFCFNKSGNRAFSHPQWKHGAQINRIDTENASRNEYAKQHAATFPVALPSEVIKAFTDSSVLDLFGGTGTTMIAAEQLGRRCYMMELDPHYCDIIIARWEKLTGQQAKKIN